MKNIFLLLLLLIATLHSQAQNTFRAQVKDAKTGEAIPDVIAGIKDSNIGTYSDSNGNITFKGLSDGKFHVSFSVIGYENKTIAIQLPDTTLTIVLLEVDENTLKDVIVASTRTDNRLEDAPIKVEVVDKEEMQEEQASRPANVVGMLGDIGGIAIQQTSAVSGNSNIRIQGLDGRYTQMLRDGMPLYDGLSSGFGILQIQPLDLKQIELIKGSASTLYGGGAISGLINFISKNPSAEQQGELILTQASLSETDVSFFLAKRYSKWGYTLFGGYTHQNAEDVNNDGLSDLPKLQSVNIHPKIFFYPDNKTIISIGYSGTNENRSGGDMDVLAGHTDSLHQYYETDKTTRNTGELLAERNFDDKVKATLKGSVSNFDEVIQTNTHYFQGSQLNYYSEASVLITKEKYNWVIGTNVTGDNFIKKQSDPTPLNDFSNNVVGGFAQFTNQLPYKTTLQAGLRIDWHDTYGGFVLPAVAAIHHFNEAFATRLGFGMGYKTPNALDQQIVEYNIEQLQPIGDSVKPELSYGYNMEVNYKKKWDIEKCLFINTSFFLTEISTPIIATELPNDNVYFSNADKPITTKGSDTYLKLQWGELEVYIGYTYTDVERKYLATNQFMPLTPRNHVAFTSTYEVEGKWRFGLESDFIGSQYRLDNSKTPAYALFAALIEKDFGTRYSIILNGENLFDYRQSRVESLYTGTITNPEFKPLWAPIDGRVITLAVRIKI